MRPDAVRPSTNDNVVTLPGRVAEPVQKSAEPAVPAVLAADRWSGVAETGSPIAAGLDAIVREDKTFDAKHFVAGARAAYEMIVTAYAEGDRRTLKNLLSKDVYDGFEAPSRSAKARARPPKAGSCRSTSPTSPAPRCAARPRKSPSGSCRSWSR